jgi:hypothetical protein
MKLNVINNYKTIYYNFLASFYLCLNCVLPYYDDVIISIQSQAIKQLIDNNSLNMKKIKKIRMIEFIDTLDKSDKIILDKEKDIIVVDYCIYKNDDASDASDASNQSSTETEPEPDPTKDICDTSENSDPDKDPYEPCKKKSRIDNDYIPRPAEPAQLSKDKDDYYNIGIYTAASAVSAAAAAVANNAAKYLLEDSEGNTTDTTEATDTADAVDEADTAEAADAADAAYSADAADAADAADTAYTKEGYGYDLDNEIDESFRNIIQNIVGIAISNLLIRNFIILLGSSI